MRKESLLEFDVPARHHLKMHAVGAPRPGCAARPGRRVAGRRARPARPLATFAQLERSGSTERTTNDDDAWDGADGEISWAEERRLRRIAERASGSAPPAFTAANAPRLARASRPAPIKEYLRLVELGDGSWELQSATAVFRRRPRVDPASGQTLVPAQEVALAATVHVGDPAYYEGLQEECDADYDAVLFELITGEENLRRSARARDGPVEGVIGFRCKVPAAAGRAAGAHAGCEATGGHAFPRTAARRAGPVRR